MEVVNIIKTRKFDHLGHIVHGERDTIFYMTKHGGKEVLDGGVLCGWRSLGNGKTDYR